MILPTIYLLRHGQTVWNSEGRYQGQLDSPLTELGRKQAEANALKLAKYVEINKVKFFSSPLGRAKDTAEIIAKKSGLENSKIIFEEAIKEFNYGIFEGKTKVFCQTELKEQYECREANKWDYVLEGGESYEEVYVRLKAWLASVKDQEVILMVAHEMINRALRGIYCNLENKEMLLLRQKNDVLIKLENATESILE